MRLLPTALLALFLANGCFIDRSGTLGADADGGRIDAGSRIDGGGRDGGFDGGFIPPPDACMPVDETCNSIDDDCDGVVDDGVSRDCANACGTPGTETCTLGTFDLCTAPSVPDETCNGVDDDCDGATDEGLARACMNRCGATGTETCSAGAYGGCTAPPEPTETCNGRDDDCDGSTDEGITRPCTNRCGTTGAETCSAGSFGGCTAPPEPTETCNGRDDDCDGSIDESAGCPCTRRTRGTQVYLFCSAATWPAARDACRALGYELVTIGDSGENGFVTSNALGDADDDWFIGINDRAVDRTWVWVSGSTTTYRNWDTGEPDNFMADAWDCGVIEDGSSGVETRAMWADMDCDNSRPFICEAP